MRHHLLALSSGLLLLAAGCQKDAEKIEPPGVGQAFPTVLIPPQGSMVSKSGSQDALQITFRTPVKLEEIASYYRSQFGKPGWIIVSDLTDSTGAVSMHVEWSATRQPMWVRLAPVGGATEVEMAGAVPGLDSAYVRRSREAADTSNTFVPR